MATLNRTFSVKNGIDVANTIIVDSSRNLSNIVSANIQTVNATTFITVAGLNVTDQANNAYAQANLAYGQANAAYAEANLKLNITGGDINGSINVAETVFANTFVSRKTALVPPNTANTHGERLRLYDFNQVGHPNYALGVEPNYIWAGTDENNGGTGFRWYGNTTLAAVMLSNGTLQLSNTVEAKVVRANGTGTAIDASSGNILTNQVTGTQFNFLAGANTITVDASGATANYTLNLPANSGLVGQLFATDGTGDAYWTSDPYVTANAAYDSANAAYAQANSNYQPAVTRLNVTNSGLSAYLFDQYSGNNPTLYVRAGETLAFSLAVTGHPFLIRVSSGGARYNTGLTHVSTAGVVTTEGNAQAQVAGTLYWKVPYELQGNTYVYQCSLHGGMVGNIVIEPPMVVAYAQANTARDAANGAYAQANGAYAQANGAYEQANGAYGQANGAYAQANGAYSQANGAYGMANLKVASITVSGNGLAVSNVTSANLNDYTISVNTASTTLRGTTLLIDSVSSTDVGNAATPNAVNTVYTYANTKLDKAGGTITGDLYIDGDIFVTGNTSYVNVSTYTVEDSLIYLASNNELSDLVDIGFMGGKNTAGVYSHTGLARHAVDGKWYLFDGLAEEGHQNNIVDVANTYLATLRANLEANSITLVGNTVATQANLTLAHNQANAAYNQANAAYADANTRVLKAGDTMTGGLTITTSGIGLTVANANVTYSLQVGTLNVTTNTVTTSSSGQVVLDKFPATQLASAKYFIQANSSTDYHTTEMVLVQDATNVWITEYGSIQTGPSLGTFSADISSGDVRLLFNANNNVNTIRAVRYGIIP